MILPSNYFPILSKNHEQMTPHFLHPPLLAPNHEATMFHGRKTKLFSPISSRLCLDVENTESHLGLANKHADRVQRHCLHQNVTTTVMPTGDTLERRQKRA